MSVLCINPIRIVISIKRQFAFEFASLVRNIICFHMNSYTCPSMYNFCSNYLEVIQKAYAIPRISNLQHHPNNRYDC